jgi:hypothetical protein
MHFSKVLIAAVTAAVAVSASPAPLDRRTNPYEDCTGDQNSSQLCCIDNSVLVELLFGLIPINVPGLLCALSSGGCVNQQLCCVNNGDGVRRLPYYLWFSFLLHPTSRH